MSEDCPPPLLSEKCLEKGETNGEETSTEAVAIVRERHGGAWISSCRRRRWLYSRDLGGGICRACLHLEDEGHDRVRHDSCFLA